MNALCRIALASLVGAVLISGCSTAYYSFMEKVAGKEKRHILSDRIKAGQEGQEEAKKQFQTTLERFKALTNFDGGELEKKYNELKSQYDKAAARADSVSSKIKSIENVAADMFKEWEAESAKLSDPNLLAKDKAILEDTRGRYNKLHDAMKAAEGKMAPVLTKFNDQVLFLKHNLNARAVSSLQGQLNDIESSVGSLIADMEKSITEANEFAKTLEGK